MKRFEVTFLGAYVIIMTTRSRFFNLWIDKSYGLTVQVEVPGLVVEFGGA